MRLFWAIELPEPIKRTLLALQKQLRSRGAEAPVHWTREEQLHLTLKFLGEASAWEPLVEAIAPLAASTPAFQLTLTHAGSFGGRTPRVVWCGVGGTGLLPLEAFVTGLEGAHQPLGFAPEQRAYRPHITLGRVRPGKVIPELAPLKAALRLPLVPPEASFEVAEIVLMDSVLHPGAPVVYKALAHLPLARPG